MDEVRGKPIDLSGALVLVTGGAGLVGSHIVDELVREGASVRVYDNLVRGRREHLTWAEANGDVTFIEGDIVDVAGLAEALRGVQYVFHEAAMWLRQCEANPRSAVDINIGGTFNVLEACVEEGVSKVVYASSSSVYGDGTYFPTNEEHPFNNDLFYGATKVAGEQLLRAFYNRNGLPYVALRYLNVYGPRQPFEAAYMDVIMHFLNRIDAEEPPIIHGDGTQTVDLVYVEDVAKANVLALKSPHENEVFNIASGRETTLKELAGILLQLAGKTDLEPVYEARDQRLVSRRFGCPKRARDVLGFEAETSVEEGLRKVIQWREAEKARAEVVKKERGDLA